MDTLDSFLGSFIVQAGGLNLAYFVVVVLAAWWLLRRLDRMAGIQDFRDVMALLMKHPQALAIYLAGRVIAIALIGAAFLG